MKKLLIISLTAFAFAVSLSGCSSDKKAELENLKKDLASTQDKISALEAELAKSDTLSDSKSKIVVLDTIKTTYFKHYIDVQAKVDGDDNVTISPETMGIISRINVKAGQSVSKGTVLIQLDDKIYMKSLDELQSSRDYINMLYIKQKSLWDQKIGTEIQFLTAKNNLEGIDKKIATVRQQLEMTKVKSPITGTVDLVDVKIGQSFAPGMPGLRVVNFDNLKLQAEVAESYISKVNKGDEVEVYFPDIDKTITTKLNYSGKVIDALNRTFRVEVLFSSKENLLHPNMVAVLRIADYKKDNSIVLPINLVQNTQEGSYVFVSENNVAVKKVVTVGRNYKGQVEILTGLKSGDLIITQGYQDMVEGQSVKS
jgi:RND family efflux transporter MFP subunit